MNYMQTVPTTVISGGFCLVLLCGNAWHTEGTVEWTAAQVSRSLAEGEVRGARDLLRPLQQPWSRRWLTGILLGA